MNKSNTILIIGAVLIALRLFFPVLQCKPEHSCNDKSIDFFSASPQWDRLIHQERTYEEAFGIGIITLALYSVFRKKS